MITDENDKRGQPSWTACHQISVRWHEYRMDEWMGCGREEGRFIPIFSGQFWASFIFLLLRPYNCEVLKNHSPMGATNRFTPVIFWLELLILLQHLWCFLEKKLSVKVAMSFIHKMGLLDHSSEIRGLCSTKCSREMLQNLLYFMCKKTHVVFIIFHFVQLYIFTLWMPWSMST